MKRYYCNRLTLHFMRMALFFISSTNWYSHIPDSSSPWPVRTTANQHRHKGAHPSAIVTVGTNMSIWTSRRLYIHPLDSLGQKSCLAPAQSVNSGYQCNCSELTLRWWVILVWQFRYSRHQCANSVWHRFFTEMNNCFNSVIFDVEIAPYLGESSIIDPLYSHCYPG